MNKITPEHLAREAYVYVRQSTADQLLKNPESRRRQYALVARARVLGWEKAIVIDDDLGRSGAGQVRPGFERLLAAICAGTAGAVLAIEASRLARNGRDWHRRDRSDVLAAPALHPKKKATQRTWRTRCGPARLDEHAARMPAALLGDPPMVCRSGSRLPHTWVQPEIADQLLGFGKTLDIADRRDQCERDNHINAGDCHQALHPFIGER